jgi:hypothetical protein
MLALNVMKTKVQKPQKVITLRKENKINDKKRS